MGVAGKISHHNLRRLFVYERKSNSRVDIDGLTDDNAATAMGHSASTWVRPL